MATRTASAAKASIVTMKSLRVGCWAVSSTFSIPASQSISIGDVIQMIAVPANSQVVALTLRSDYVQATLTVGDGLDDNRYVGSPVSTSALFAVAFGGPGLAATVVAPYTYSTDDTIDIFVSLVSVTSVLGAFYMTAIMTMDPTQYN